MGSAGWWQRYTQFNIPQQTLNAHPPSKIFLIISRYSHLGKSGLVVEIRGWDNISCRSVANVSWVSGSTNVYRLGHKGNVDLKYIQAASGGFYYRDHMPILGRKEELQPIAASTRSTFTVGDRVRVCLERNALIKLQQGHGGWNTRMADYLNKVGCVHRITDKGDIRYGLNNSAIKEQ